MRQAPLLLVPLITVHYTSVVRHKYGYLWAPLKIQFSRQDKARVKNLSAAYI
ncbi:hypothetical protein NTGBS_330043 [Candidatus Nitrotoga sp. BS]|nr:hypothetical protein NTGBS_330043 [Candidatus Nitrotoga sp. BS]